MMLHKPINEHSIKNPENQTEDDSSFCKLVDLFYGNWIWRAVHALIDHPQFKPSPTWISESLSVSVEEVVDALEGLEDLGLIHKQNDTYRATAPNFLLPEKKANKNYSRKKHRQLSQQLLAKTDLSSVEGTMAYFLTVDRPQLYQVIREVMQRFQELDKVENRKSDPQLFAVTLACTNLAPSLNGGRK